MIMRRHDIAKKPYRVEQRQYAVSRVPQRVRHAVEAAVKPDQGAGVEGFEVQRVVVEHSLRRCVRADCSTVLDFRPS